MGKKTNKSINKEINNNINLLLWYECDSENYIHNELTDKLVFTDNTKEFMFNLFTLAINEDPYVFFRIFMYILNTRKTEKNYTLREYKLKALITYIASINSYSILANIDLFLNVGYKNDILLYFVNSLLTKNLLIYVKQKVVFDTDFKSLYDGNLIKENKTNILKYKTNGSYKKLLEFILDEPLFNGLNL